MRTATLILGLAALLALAACGGGDQNNEQATGADLAAQHAASGDCDPANHAGKASDGCASAASGGCAKAGGCAKTAGAHGAQAAHAAHAETADLPVPAGKAYGAGVTSGGTVAVSALLAAPDHYLGKVVRVQGPIVGVCKHRGCWLEIASDQEMQKIQLKVNDGEIVFPPEVMGENAIVEGVFEGIPLTYEQSCAFLEQEATCQGETFDKSTVPAEGVTFYRIKGTGAVVLAQAGS